MGPAVAVVSGERVYIIDCGPGVVRRAAEAGIKMEQLTRAFITHLHSDHTAGYPDLIFTPAEIVAYLSEIFTLQPGDVVATGTPDGVAAARQPPPWLRPGQTVTTVVDGVGELSNRFVGPAVATP